MVSGMHVHPIATPTSGDIEDSPRGPTGLVMSRAEYAVLVQELETLRSAHHRGLAKQLHDVRAHGTTSDNDDRLAVLEETAVGRARITKLEDLVRYATVLDDEEARSDGAAGLGSRVEVADDEGRTTEYQLIGRRTSTSAPAEVSLGSPVGQALVGARTGDVVNVRLPRGGDRSLTVLAVSGGVSRHRAKAA
jgi:transcription elongation factor GreA